MSDFPMDAAQWDAGLPFDAYLAQMTMFQPVMRRRLDSVQLRPDERDALGRHGQVAHVLVMTEDWCGDAVLNAPIVMRIAEALPVADLRVFVRTAAPELNAHYAGRGIIAIPVVTFLDADFRELATWVERPRAADLLRVEWMAANPDFDLTRKPADLTPDERAFRVSKLKELLAAMEAWYDGGVQSDTVAEILALLNRSAATTGEK
jgi:hypothetical protein